MLPWKLFFQCVSLSIYKWFKHNTTSKFDLWHTGFWSCSTFRVSLFKPVFLGGGTSLFFSVKQHSENGCSNLRRETAIQFLRFSAFKLRITCYVWKSRSGSEIPLSSALLLGHSCRKSRSTCMHLNFYLATWASYMLCAISVTTRTGWKLAETHWWPREEDWHENTLINLVNVWQKIQTLN